MVRDILLSGVAASVGETAQQQHPKRDDRRGHTYRSSENELEIQDWLS
jgi:hypothetical protein